MGFEFSQDSIDAFQARVLSYLPKFGASILILLGFWIAARVISAVINRVGAKARLNVDILRLLDQTVHYSILAVGVITALGTMGIDVRAAIAGLGLTGLALGIALKDIVSNVIAGVMLLIYEPFVRGDRIAVSGMEGRVLEINLRYTVLEGEQRKLLIPNQNLFTNPLTVFRDSASGWKTPTPRNAAEK